MNPIDSILARLLALHPKRIDLSLDRVQRLLAALGSSRAQAAAGDPCRRHQRQGLDHRLPARDSGSGGFARARLHLAASGAVSTSAFGSARSGEGKLVVATPNCRRRWKNASAPMAARRSPCSKSPPRPGLLLFSRHPADVLLLEVGLGGRLDATNVIDKPLATHHHAGVDRPHRFSRRYAGKNRGRESRHHQSRLSRSSSPRSSATRSR